ncbi:helix-turn-helix domain-containing protein [Kribbella sp. NPDC000426]|uniref:PucR family transcriptional regulator n=1 Tax=Kribbella sp. NPDC000426 TaxID=3154255 RepID=UPI00331F5460
MTHSGATGGPDPALVALAGRLLGELDGFADEIASAIEARLDFYAAHTVVPADDLRASVRGNLEYVLRSLREDQYADVAAARTTGALRAEQGVPLAVVMAAFRILFSQIWHSLVRHARAHQQVSNQALVDAASDLWSAHDTFAEEMAAAHREATMTLVLRNEGERSALVGALLEGRPLPETSVWDVADVLRLPKRGPFVVVAAEAVQLAQEALPGVENRLRARRIGSAWRLMPDAQIGIVRFENDADIRPLTTILTAAASSRVGISPPYAALTETAAALRFARIAMASTAAGAPHVTMFDDFPLSVAAVSTPEVMQRVRQTVLGPILDLPAEQCEVLLETLAAWRDNGGSAAAAAKVLFCHPNTVRHRLRRVEATTGRSLSDPRATAEILIALEAASLELTQSSWSDRRT